MRQIEPLREKVDDILADVKTVTARVSQQTERVDHAISDTMGRVDDTAERVKTIRAGEGEPGDRRGPGHPGGDHVAAGQRIAARSRLPPRQGGCSRPTRYWVETEG